MSENGKVKNKKTPVGAGGKRKELTFKGNISNCKKLTGAV